MQWPNPADPARGHDNAWTFGSRISIFLGNRVLPLREMGGRWQGNLGIEDRNLAMARSIVDLHASRGGWEVGTAYRLDMQMEGNRDSVEALSLLRGKKDLPAGRRFDVRLTANGFAGEEFRVARRWAPGGIRGFSAGVSLGLLHGERIQNGSIAGTLNATGPRSYDYSLAADYAYDINYLYKGSPVLRDDRDGYGYTAGIGIRYERKGFVASIRAEELLNRIYWRKVPVTTATGTSGGRRFDSEGYVHYDPLISGFEGRKSLSQRLPGKYSGEAAKTWETFRVAAALDRMRSYSFPRASVGGRIDERSGWWSVAYDLFFRTVGLRYEGKHACLAVYTDRFELDKTRAIGMRGELSW